MGRRTDEAVTGDQRAAAWQSRHPQLIAWSIEFDDIRRRYPSPRLSREVRDLMRALRMLRGEVRRSRPSGGCVGAGNDRGDIQMTALVSLTAERGV